MVILEDEGRAAQSGHLGSDFGLPGLSDRNHNVGECGEPGGGWGERVLLAADQEVLDWRALLPTTLPLM